MTTQEVATAFVNYLKEGKYDEAQKEFFSNDIVSVEPEGAPDRIQKGMKAILEKGVKFYDMVETIHTNEVSDPLVADKYFCCSIKSKMSFKGVPEPLMVDELVIYHVEEGKVNKEEFFYTYVPW